MIGPDFNTESNLHADTVAERWESEQEDTFLGPCSCSDGGKCKHNEQGPLCMQEDFS